MCVSEDGHYGQFLFIGILQEQIPSLESSGCGQKQNPSSQRHGQVWGTAEVGTVRQFLLLAIWSPLPGLCPCRNARIRPAAV